MALKKTLSDLSAAVGATALSKAFQGSSADALRAGAKQAAQLAKLNLPVEAPYGNGAAATPPMGWSSWNTFRNRISESLVLEVAQAMQKGGLLDAGYRYLNIDDCWQSSQRDANGRLQADLVTFPGGIPALVQQVNARGLKLGLYSSNGSLTCEDLPASLGREALDARTLAEWGVEYFKYDFCHNEAIPMRAPCIEKIAVSALGSGQETYYGVEDATLEGGAVLVEDDRLETGKYVAGLSFGSGAVVFRDVTAEEDGLYALTLCIRKKSHSKKFAVIEINGAFAADTTVPPTWAMTKEGRHQLILPLRKGANTVRICNPIASRFDSAAYQYAKMGKALRRATADYAEAAGLPEKKINYSICEWGLHLPWKWGRSAGNLWRTTLDIKPFWASILGIYEINVRLAEHAGPGGWNDPDMLEVGNGGLNYEENRAHFTLWCMMAAPLILGNDVRVFLRPDGTPDTTNAAWQIVTNRDVIAIDQDPLGVQCRRIWTNGTQDVLLKPLAGGEVAVCFFNKATESRHFTLRMNTVAAKDFVNLPFAAAYEARELWNGRSETVTDELRCTVAPHGVKVFRIAAKESE
ncbi:MAG: alpha-galactosidase [Oscillospiraceae bacterium]|nr:alpha-galactosidase [Oscillospiraceae bacterium]